METFWFSYDYDYDYDGYFIRVNRTIMIMIMIMTMIMTPCEPGFSFNDSTFSTWLRFFNLVYMYVIMM